MRLVFTKLETDATEIKVAFDGVNFKSYSTKDIERLGYISFTEEECPDLTKVKIQGKFKSFDSIGVNKTIALEPGKNGIEYTFEKDVFEDVTYYCFTLDDNRNGEIDEDEFAQAYWVKDIDTNEPQEFYYAVANSNEGYYDGLPPKADYLKAADSNDVVARINGNIMTIFTRTSDGELVEQEESFIQYPDGDLHEKKAVGTETAIELITEIQDVPTITESGKLTADKGKAFKTVDIGDNFVEKEYFVGELYDGGCGYGYRIKSWPESIKVKNPNLLNEFHLSDGVTLSRLCDYSSYLYYGYTQDKTPQGRLYLSKVVDRIPCGTEELLIPTHYYLK